MRYEFVPTQPLSRSSRLSAGISKNREIVRPSRKVWENPVEPVFRYLPVFEPIGMMALVDHTSLRAHQPLNNNFLRSVVEKIVTDILVF